MDVNHTFFLGALGAIAPEIVRLYSLKTKPEEFRWSSWYFLFSTLFAILGGVVALILPATTYWGAMYAGISTPTLLNVGATRARAPRRRPQKKSGVLSGAASAGYGPAVRTKSIVDSFLGGL